MYMYACDRMLRIIWRGPCLVELEKWIVEVVYDLWNLFVQQKIDGDPNCEHIGCGRMEGDVEKEVEA